MPKSIYQSETSKHRARLAPYCKGYGIDLGYGGDPITPDAIRVDLELPYGQTGEYGVQLGGDCRNIFWFGDGVLDFVYSSHVLEDFDVQQTVPIMREWSRVLKEGGHLILLQPDQQRYLAYCKRTNQPPNPHHSFDNFSLQYVLDAAKKTGCLEVVASADEIDEYSFFAVFSKKGAARMDTPGTDDEFREEIKRLRLELARTESQRQQAQNSLDRYRNHPVVRLLKKIRSLVKSTGTRRENLPPA